MTEFEFEASDDSVSDIEIRMKACELAALVGSGQVIDGPRLMSLCVFFETYILEGANATDSAMQLLSNNENVGDGPKRDFRVVAGGALNSRFETEG